MTMCDVEEVYYSDLNTNYDYSTLQLPSALQLPWASLSLYVYLFFAASNFMNWFILTTVISIVSKEAVFIENKPTVC